MKTFFNYDAAKNTNLTRFAQEKFMKFSYGTYDIFGSWFWFEFTNLPVLGIHIVEKEENRPDLLSYNIYGETQYWWLLMQYNGFITEKDIKKGDRVKFFALEDLNRLYYEAGIKQNKYDSLK